MRKRSVIFGGFVLILLGLTNCFGQIKINEVQYNNKGTLVDNFGDTPDWIEIYNDSNTSINLGGYKITDDKNLLDFWTFPDTVILPKSYLIIYASGRDAILESGLHSDFKLKLMSEPVILLNSIGEVIDKIPITCVPPGKALGCSPDGSEDRYVLSPSPSTTNNYSAKFNINFQKDSLIVSYPSGFYNDTICIKLINQNPSNKVFYTLNGEVPDPEESLYTKSFTLKDINNSPNRFANLSDNDFEPGNLLSKGNILRARVFSEGCPASNEIQNTYFISNNGEFDYEVPIVSIITEKDNLFDDDMGIYTKGKHKNYDQRGKKWERDAHLEYFDFTKRQIIDQNIGIRIHGNGSRMYPQKSLRLSAREEYGKEKFEYKFFKQKDIQSFKTLLLSAEITFSPIVFKDEICHDLASGMNMDYQAWQPVIVYINGEYWGIHHLREYQKEDYFYNNYHEHEDSIVIIEYMRGSGPKSIQGDGTPYQDMVDFIAFNDIKDDEVFSQLETMIDVDNTIDFFITQLYFANTDFPENNNRLWQSQRSGSKWRWLFFDCEGGMHFTSSDKMLAYTNAPEDKENTPAWSVYLLHKMLFNKTFAKKFYSRFIYCLSNDFAPEVVLEKIKSYKNFYEPLMGEHIYRWNYPNSIGKWKENVGTIETFALLRPVYLNTQLLELFGNPFIVFPNPSKGEVKINFFGSQSSKSYRIYDINGTIISAGEIFNNGVFSINTNLGAGVYLLQVTLDQFSYTEKLLIQ